MKQTFVFILDLLLALIVTIPENKFTGIYEEQALPAMFVNMVNE